MLNNRAQNLLTTLIDHYIVSGQPVGSRSLADTPGVSLSPASVRNVLSELEEAGFLASPHTSAGRIPTAMGYRFFVDTHVAVQPIDQIDPEQLAAKIDVSNSPHELLQSATTLLSDLTHFVGIVTLPKRNKVTLSHVEFLHLSSRKVLSVLVLSSGEIENRLINTAKEYSRSQLETAANYLNKHFTGLSLEALRSELLAQMARDQSDIDALLKTVLDVAEKAFTEEDYFIDGERNLLAGDQSQDLLKVRALFDAFSEKNEILTLLDQCLDSDGIQIFIGEESGHASLGEHSLIVSSYRAGDNVMGTLGIIGPTRMHYDRVIPIVDATARLLSAALNE